MMGERSTRLRRAKKKGAHRAPPTPTERRQLWATRGPKDALVVARDHALNLKRIMANTGGAEFDLNQNHATHREKDTAAAGAGARKHSLTVSEVEARPLSGRSAMPRIGRLGAGFRGRGVVIADDAVAGPLEVVELAATD